MTLPSSRQLLGRAQLTLPRVAPEKAENWNCRGAWAETAGHPGRWSSSKEPLSPFFQEMEMDGRTNDWEWSPCPWLSLGYITSLSANCFQFFWKVSHLFSRTTHEMMVVLKDKLPTPEPPPKPALHCHLRLPQIDDKHWISWCSMVEKVSFQNLVTGIHSWAAPSHPVPPGPSHPHQALRNKGPLSEPLQTSQLDGVIKGCSVNRLCWKVLRIFNSHRPQALIKSF